MAAAARFVPVHTLLVLFAAGVLVATFRMLLFARQLEPESIMPLGKRSLIGPFVGGFAGFMGGMLGRSQLGGSFMAGKPKLR